MTPIVDARHFTPPRREAAPRCRDAMRRFEQFRSRLSIAVGTIAAAVAMTVFICRTAHLLG